MFSERLLASLLLTTLDICRLIASYHAGAWAMLIGLAVVMAADEYMRERSTYD